MADSRKRVQHVGIHAEAEGAEYFEKRQLQGGVAGWILLAGLGVAYVSSGYSTGWDFGLSEGGWGGLLIATIVMAIMYLFSWSLASASTAATTSWPPRKRRSST